MDISTTKTLGKYKIHAYSQKNDKAIKTPLPISMLMDL